jgi:hypothetical protein
VSGRGEGLSAEEMEAQDASTLPDREAMSTLDPTGTTSLLDIDANIDAALDIAAPIDAAVAANANVAAPIDAAVSANALSPGAEALASAPQTSLIDQDLDGVANATADQDSTIGQGETPDSTTEAP